VTLSASATSTGAMPSPAVNTAMSPLPSALVTEKPVSELLGASGNPVKEAGAWIVEKMGAAAGEANDDLGLLRMVEALTMGVKAKQCLWEALEEIAGADSRLEGFDFEQLISGARSQLEGLEAAQRRGGSGDVAGLTCPVPELWRRILPSEPTSSPSR
jgi:hypothetical protein